MEIEAEIASWNIHAAWQRLNSLHHMRAEINLPTTRGVSDVQRT